LRPDAMADEKHFVPVLYVEVSRHRRRGDLVGVSRLHTGGHHETERGDACRGQNVALSLPVTSRMAVCHLLSFSSAFYAIVTIARRDSLRLHLCSSEAAVALFQALSTRYLEYRNRREKDDMTPWDRSS